MTSTTRNYTPQEILALPMEDNDAGAGTIGQYLVELNYTLWFMGEDFSGKRPFGNSSWDGEIIRTLLAHEAITGGFDEDGFLEDYDRPEISQIMGTVFAFLRRADWTTLQLPPTPKDWIVIALNPQEDTVEHHVDVMLDEASAKATAEQHNQHATTWKWAAIRVPK